MIFGGIARNHQALISGCRGGIVAFVRGRGGRIAGWWRQAVAVEGVGGAGAFLAFEGFLGAGAAVQGAVLRGGGGGFGLGALFADAAEVDDLGHAAILA